MARISNLVITQSISELKKLLKVQTKHKNIERLQALICLKEERFITREALSQHFRVSRRTMERWISHYRKGGLKGLLLPEKRNRKSYLIPEQVDKALKQRVMNSEQGFISYVDAQQWVASEYKLDLKYNTIREHLIRHYKTKVKSPRKSHVNKDNEAVEAFLKTT